ncbi:hypothetical protein V1477_007997 [Vespula maculifrons]|uniref:Uncharacterized protein n=1 Tax=Vespula maculifrons TaxID=7453 RepID=A0ABD2CF90_VESMC
MITYFRLVSYFRPTESATVFGARTYRDPRIYSLWINDLYLKRMRYGGFNKFIVILELASNVIISNDRSLLLVMLTLLVIKQDSNVVISSRLETFSRKIILKVRLPFKPESLFFHETTAFFVRLLKLYTLRNYLARKEVDLVIIIKKIKENNVISLTDVYNFRLITHESSDCYEGSGPPIIHQTATFDNETHR